MPMIPVLEFEEKVQIGDKTRLVGEKSFVTTGETPLTAMTIKPGDDETAIDVFDADPKKRYLDWVYSDEKYDIDSSNDTIYFYETSDLVAIVASGTYSLSGLLVAIKTALEAASSHTYTYTVTVNVRRQIKIVATGSFILKPAFGANSLLLQIGFQETTNSGLSQEGLPLEYSIRKLTIEVDNGSTPVSKVYYQKIYTQSGDALFSNDFDLTNEESDILGWVVKGRTSYLNIHRAVQEDILNWLDQNGYVDSNEKPFTKFAVVNISEVRTWAKYLALHKIYSGIGNAKDDVFKQKASTYETKALKARSRVVIRLDVDGDGVEDAQSSPYSWGGTLSRR